MPDIKPSGGRLGTLVIIAVLGLATLGGAGYMFFLRGDSDPVVVQRRPAVATPVARVTPSLEVTPFEPAVVQETPPESFAITAVVEPAANPTTPDPLLQEPTASENTPVEEAVVAVVPEPVAEPSLVAEPEVIEPAPVVQAETSIEPAAPIEEESFAVAEPSPVAPIETIAEREPVVAEIELPAATEPEPAVVPAAEPPAAEIAETPTPAPAVVESAPTPEPVVAIDPPAPAPAPVVAVAEPAVATPEPPAAPAPAPAVAAPAPPPEPVTVADPEIQSWVSSIKVAGLRMGPVPKVLMNDRVYAQGEMVQFDFELRLIEVTETLLKFKDPEGHTYFFRL